MGSTMLLVCSSIHQAYVGEHKDTPDWSYLVSGAQAYYCHLESYGLIV